MSDAFFSNPIINSPYGHPNQHWELDGDGQNWMRTGFSIDFLGIWETLNKIKIVSGEYSRRLFGEGEAK